MLSYENRPTMAQPTPATSDHLPINTSSSNTLSNGTRPNSSQPQTEHHHLWLITGPAGCGKSTVAQYLAKTMNLPYIEGDEVLPLLLPPTLSQLEANSHSFTRKPTWTRCLKESPSPMPIAGTGSRCCAKKPSPASPPPGRKASSSPAPPSSANTATSSELRHTSPRVCACTSYFSMRRKKCSRHG